jgi:signal transduction histidine kinase
MEEINSKKPTDIRILIAEDSPTQAERLEHCLRRTGYQVIRTSNGRLALETIRRDRPTLVISDIMMPEMDGYQLCCQIKSDPQLKTLPVILVTTLADPQDVIRGLECRADNFLIKPYDERYLLSRIQFVLLNGEMREHDQGALGVEIFFNGQRHFITADRLQILNLLLSTYEVAIQRNQELSRTKDELRTAIMSLESANKDLEQKIISERQMHEELKSAQSQLVQAEKLASLGQMVAGVAHEINNPLSFVGNNLWVLHRDLSAVKGVMNIYRGEDVLIAQHHPLVADRLKELTRQNDLNYTLDNIDQMITSSQEGLKRIEQIVHDLRDFARLDQSQWQQVDINAGIRSTINIINGRARNKHVNLELNLTPLPPITCHPAKINQVVMNLVSNAIDACAQGGTVTVSTRPDQRADAGIQIEVADTGVGIEPAIQERIFDPFFTTKPQGQGTGLGLSISYGIIKEHQGRIEVNSLLGEGSRFIVHIPNSAAA